MSKSEEGPVLNSVAPTLSEQFETFLVQIDKIMAKAIQNIRTSGHEFLGKGAYIRRCLLELLLSVAAGWENCLSWQARSDTDVDASSAVSVDLAADGRSSSG